MKQTTLRKIDIGQPFTFDNDYYVKVETSPRIGCKLNLNLDFSGFALRLVDMTVYAFSLDLPVTPLSESLLNLPTVNAPSSQPVQKEPTCTPNHMVPKNVNGKLQWVPANKNPTCREWVKQTPPPELYHSKTTFTKPTPVQQPPVKTPSSVVRYVCANYDQPKDIHITVIQDGNGTPCYLNYFYNVKWSSTKVAFYTSRQAARNDKNTNASVASVWKVLVNEKTGKITEWLRKNP